MEQHRRIKANISVDIIEQNFESMRNNISKETKIIAVVKADGYGHGAVAIAARMEPKDYIWGFAVAAAEEAFELRKAGVQKPILILGPVFPEYYEELVLQEIRIPVMTWEEAKDFSDACKAAGRHGYVHIALDTGMSRIGFSDTEESACVVREIAGLPDLSIEGLFTHFARADEEDVSPALVQLERYERFAELLEEKGVNIPLHHCSNSAGIIRMPQANMNLVRAGITIYGIYPSDEVEREPVPLKPAMELISHVSYIKDLPAGAAISYGGTYVTERPSRIATIPTGYADGYPRLLSNKGSVLIHGKRAPIRGRVCMDQFMVDVTDIPDVSKGDRVVLMGQDGDDAITADELGALSGRFPYELICCISPRVPRVYL